jgi:hypothetical protein
LSLEKLVNGKHFPIKGKFGLVSRKVFFFYFEQKTLSGSYEKFRNVILFANYIKFGPQTFDYYQTSENNSLSQNLLSEKKLLSSKQMGSYYKRR